MYLDGKGVPEDAKEAEKWFRKAADQRSYHALIDLGSMYLHGKGMPEDAEEAEK